MSVIDKLVALLERLYNESEGYEQDHSEGQLWYNRGYANGMASFLRLKGYTAKIEHLNLDAENLYHNDQVMEWHKAYHHGFEMGLRESEEITSK